MNRIVIFFLSFFLLSVPALAAEEPDPDAPPASDTDLILDLSEYLYTSDAAGEGFNEQVYSELVQLRANTEYIFLGVIALSGVVLGSFVGVTLIRLWGA